jgi:predicted amidohydrolase
MPLARAAMHAKREVLHVAQWPAVKELHQIASRQYAFEGQCFVAAAGCMLSKKDVLDGFTSLGQPENPAGELLASMPGDADRLFLHGGSTLIAPSADYVTEPLFNEVGIVYAALDPALITQGHLTIDTDGHYARPDVFQLMVDERPQTNVVFKK